MDWEATKKYEADFSSGKLRVHVETPEEREEREKEEANSPEISSGLRLPGTGGVFLLDQFDGKPELAEILQNGSELNQSANKKSVLRTAINPIGSSKHAFELKGPHAKIQSHVPTPVHLCRHRRGRTERRAAGGTVSHRARRREEGPRG